MFGAVNYRAHPTQHGIAKVLHDYDMGKPIWFSFTRLCYWDVQGMTKQYRLASGGACGGSRHGGGYGEAVRVMVFWEGESIREVAASEVPAVAGPLSDPAWQASERAFRRVVGLVGFPPYTFTTFE